MSYLSDPDRLERLAAHALDFPPNATPEELSEALSDAAERIRSLQERDRASRKLVAAARVLATASEAEMIRLTGMAYPNGDFQCPADPCPYCTAQDEFAIALMDYEGGD